MLKNFDIFNKERGKQKDSSINNFGFHLQLFIIAMCSEFEALGKNIVLAFEA